MNISITIPDRRARRKRAAAVGMLQGVGLGVAASFFFDSVSGRRRRKQTVDRIAGAGRRSVRRGTRLARGVVAQATGKAERLRHLSEEPKDFDDATLARKVETEIFRSPEVPKGQISVNAQRGIVQLRGEVPSGRMIEDLVERTRSVQGVRSVENLLHLPDMPAPMHQ